jgi:glyoxylase-like metal-dependent hydrolase (beta-lactamase superfamily II)
MRWQLVANVCEISCRNSRPMIEIQLFNQSTLYTPGNYLFQSQNDDDWKKIYPADAEGDCELANKVLIIKKENIVVLFDSGFSRYDTASLNEYRVKNFQYIGDILKQASLTTKDITHVVHTHLHLDHCGESIDFAESGEGIKRFSKALYVTAGNQLKTATDKESSEYDSFYMPIVRAFNNNCCDIPLSNDTFLFPWLELRIFNGHTRGLIVPIIHGNKETLVFAGDLAPTMAHLTLQLASKYDVNPLLALAERDDFLDEVIENEYIIAFQHDLYHEACKVKRIKDEIVAIEYKCPLSL